MIQQQFFALRKIWYVVKKTVNIEDMWISKENIFFLIYKDILYK